MSKLPMDKLLHLSKVVNMLPSKLTYQIMVNNIDTFHSPTPQTNTTTIDLLSHPLPLMELTYNPKKSEIKLNY